MLPVFQFNSKNRFYKFLNCIKGFHVIPLAGLKICIINLYHICIDEFVFAMHSCFIYLFFFGEGGYENDYYSLSLLFHLLVLYF